MNNLSDPTDLWAWAIERAAILYPRISGRTPGGASVREIAEAVLGLFASPPPEIKELQARWERKAFYGTGVERGDRPPESSGNVVGGCGDAGATGNDGGGKGGSRLDDGRIQAIWNAIYGHAGSSVGASATPTVGPGAEAVTGSAPGDA